MRSDPITSAGQFGPPTGWAVLDSGPKHVGETPAGRGPMPMYSLSLNVTLSFSSKSLSGLKSTTPSPGWRGSPTPPHTATSSVGLAPGIGTHGRDHVKPPLVERLTNTPLVSS